MCSFKLRREEVAGSSTPLPHCTPSSPNKCSLTPLLHEDEEVIQELFPFRVTIQFIELWGGNKDEGTSHNVTENQVIISASSNGDLVLALEGESKTRKDC